MEKVFPRTFSNGQTIKVPNIFIEVILRCFLRRNEFVEIISKLYSLCCSLEDIESLNYFEKCNILNSNAVVLARHFQHRIELFLKKWCLLEMGNLLVTYYAIRVEFQFRGSPHIHSFLSIPNAPTLNENLTNEYVNSLDFTACRNLPSEQEDSRLYKLLQTFEIHSYSKICRKYNNMKCRSKFDRFFTEKTIVAKPLQNIC